MYCANGVQLPWCRAGAEMRGEALRECAMRARGEGWRVGRVGEEWDGVTTILVDEL